MPEHRNAGNFIGQFILGQRNYISSHPGYLKLITNCSKCIFEHYSKSLYNWCIHQSWDKFIADGVVGKGGRKDADTRENKMGKPNTKKEGRGRQNKT